MGATKRIKKSPESINSRLQLVAKSMESMKSYGKYALGYKQTLKVIRHNKGKLVILVNRHSTLRKSDIILHHVGPN